jgi:cytochrome P450 family 6
MYELAINENIQENAREEVIKVAENHNGRLSYEAISEMKYLEKCVFETVRKYPGLFLLKKESTKEYTFPNTNITIPKGTTVHIPAYAFHHDEEYFPEPHRFDPERFSQTEIEKRHPMACQPFSVGPRHCIGKRFSLIVIKLGIATILQKYKFTVDRTKTSVPIKISPSGNNIDSAEKIYINFTHFNTS